MSRDNVELVRRIYDAAARGDDETPFEIYAEDIVWDCTHVRQAALMSRPVFHGHDGVRETWREGLTLFKDVRMELDELEDLGDHHVLARVRERHLGRSSGAPVENVHYALWAVAGEKVTSMRMFEDREPALEAARAGS